MRGSTEQSRVLVKAGLVASLATPLDDATETVFNGADQQACLAQLATDCLFTLKLNGEDNVIADLVEVGYIADSPLIRSHAVVAASSSAETDNVDGRKRTPQAKSSIGVLSPRLERKTVRVESSIDRRDHSLHYLTFWPRAAR